MPEQYEAMRDSFIGKGMSSKAAKGKAARIYNSKHPGAPVTGKHKAKKRKKRATKYPGVGGGSVGGYSAA